MGTGIVFNAYVEYHIHFGSSAERGTTGSRRPVGEGVSLFRGAVRTVLILVYRRLLGGASARERMTVCIGIRRAAFGRRSRTGMVRRVGQANPIDQRVCI